MVSKEWIPIVGIIIHFPIMFFSISSSLASQRYIRDGRRHFKANSLANLIAACFFGNLFCVGFRSGALNLNRSFHFLFHYPYMSHSLNSLKGIM